MREDQEWASSNIDTEYPFIEKSSTFDQFSDAIGDAAIFGIGGSDVRVARLDSPATGAVLRLVTSTGALLCEFSSCTVSVFGRWTLATWTSGTKIARILFLTERLAGLAFPFVGFSPRLAQRTLNPSNPGVTGLGTEMYTARGDVELEAGYNVSFVQADNTVTLDAIVGSGAGAGVSEDTRYVRSFNGTGPTDEGSFFMTGEDCFFVTEGTNSIRFANHCVPCADCEDFGQVYEFGITEVYTMLKHISDRLQVLYAKYLELKAALEHELEIRKNVACVFFLNPAFNPDAEPNHYVAWLYVENRRKTTRIKKIEYTLNATPDKVKTTDGYGFVEMAGVGAQMHRNTRSMATHVYADEVIASQSVFYPFQLDPYILGRKMTLPETGQANSGKVSAYELNPGGALYVSARLYVQPGHRYMNLTRTGVQRYASKYAADVVDEWGNIEGEQENIWGQTRLFNVRSRMYEKDKHDHVLPATNFMVQADVIITFSDDTTYTFNTVKTMALDTGR